MIMYKLFIVLILILILLKITNVISYSIIKNSILKSRKWDLNICCGSTDGGGINSDITKHGDIPNFVLNENIYNLPFADKQFEYVLCSHTVEHIDNPDRFIMELNRVGKNLVILIPPLWDFSAAFNFLEHKWVFLSFRTKVSSLPQYIHFPFANWYHKKFGQKIKA